MINSNLLTDELAEKISAEAVKFHIAAEAGRILRHMVIGSIKETLKEDDKKVAHDILFTALFKSLAPFEKQFQMMLKRIWGEEERILIANIKKMKKAWLHKDKIDDIMYPRKPFEKKLTTESRKIIVETMKKQGDIEAAKLEAQLKHKGYKKADEPLSISFDVNNPEVQKWLNSYVPMFSEKLEDVNVKKLRATLIEGIEAGEGVPELTNRVYETYKDWGFKRAEDIAQNQVIRASNKAALNVYRQSGVVTKKIWLSYLDDRVCPHCESLDGKVVGLETNFFDIGDESIVKVDGKEQKLSMNYEPIEAPPLHNRCRCSISPWIED